MQKKSNLTMIFFHPLPSINHVNAIQRHHSKMTYNVKKTVLEKSVLQVPTTYFYSYKLISFNRVIANISELFFDRIFLASLQ